MGDAVTNDCVACGCPVSVPRFHWPPFTLHACRDCGTTQIVPLPDAEFLSHYYDREYAIVAESERADLRARAERYPDTPRIVRLLRRLAPRARRVAEVGCAYGYLLWGLREAGYEVTGYELSRTTAAAGREVLGLPIQALSLPGGDERFDAIVIRHVLEHFRDPGAALDQLVRSLTVGGVLVLATPNPESVSARLFGREWEWMSPPAHLHLFTARGLKRALERRGFEVLEVETRRGDARPFGFALLRWLAVRVGAKRALTQRLGTFGPDATAVGLESRAARAKRALLGSLSALDRFASPLWWWAVRTGAGEELWCVARRGEFPPQESPGR
ncbi:MAG: class I SAM-dependent methyltransferase [Candidatus Eiseniibacteriota bacterium]